MGPLHSNWSQIWKVSYMFWSLKAFGIIFYSWCAPLILTRWQNCSLSVIPVLLGSSSSRVSFLLHVVQPTSSATLLHHPVTRVWAQINDEVDKHKTHHLPSLTSRVTSFPEETEGASGPQALHPTAGHAAPPCSRAPGEGSLSITIPPASHKRSLFR